MKNLLKTFLDAAADRASNTHIGPRPSGRPAPSEAQQREIIRQREAEAVQLTERLIRRDRRGT